MCSLLAYASHHEHVWAVKVQIHAFLTLTLDGSEWSASCPGHFNPRETTLASIGQEAGWTPEPVWA